MPRPVQSRQAGVDVRLVRARMAGTGERYTTARAALAAQREPGGLVALDDEHPQVRRQAVHSLGCENCKPNGCAADVRPLLERAIGDDSRLVRSMVLHVVTLGYFHHQWAVDLVAGAASGKSAKLRQSAADAIAWLGRHWDSDDRRRELAPDVVARTGRHPGQWVVVRDGRVVATSRDSKASRRELSAGGRAYWVAPPGTARPRIP